MIRLRRHLAMAAAAATIGSALLPASVAAVTPITFSISLNYSCVGGTAEANADLLVRLYAPNGDLVQRAETVVGGGGYWSACFDHVVGPGDQVRATGGGADRTITLPNLTLKVNRATDVASGKWIPSTAVTACVQHYSTYQAFVFECVSGTSTGAGSYSLDFTPVVNVDGGDQVVVSYDVGADHFQINVWTPFMIITRAEAFVSGSLNPGQVAKITLKDGSNNVRGSTTVQNDMWSEFKGEFRNAAGNIVRARVGDIAVGGFASDATITIPNITASGDAATDVVTGHCMPNRPFEIYARKPNYSDQDTRWGITDGSGNFSRDFSSSINLVAGDIIRVSCLYATGDQVRRFGYVTA